MCWTAREFSLQPRPGIDQPEGSGGASSTVTVQTCKMTPRGTYSLALTGIDGTGSPKSGGLTHSIKVALDGSIAGDEAGDE